MATLYWIGGAGTQLWTSTSNWSATRGGASSGTIPATGDTVYIIDGNSQIAGSDQSAVALAGLTIAFSPTTGASVPALSIGSNGTPLLIGLADGALGKVTGNTGDIYMGIAFSGVFTARMEFLGTGNVYVGGVTAPGSGTILVGERAGKVTIGSDYGGSFAVRGLGGTVDISATAIVGSAPLVTIDDGQITSDRNLSTCQVGGGRLIVRRTSTMSLVTVMPEGKYNHQSTGTITTISLSKGGIATDSGAPGPFVVTNSTAAKGASLFEQPHVSITYSNATSKLGYA